MSTATEAPTTETPTTEATEGPTEAPKPEAPAAPKPSRTARPGSAYAWLDRISHAGVTLLNPHERMAADITDATAIRVKPDGSRVEVEVDLNGQTVEVPIIEPMFLQYRALGWINHWASTLGNVWLVRAGDGGKTSKILLAAGAIGREPQEADLKRIAVMVHKRLHFPSDEGLRVADIQALLQSASWPVIDPSQWHATLTDDGQVEMTTAAALHAWTGRQWVDPMTINASEAYSAFAQALSGFGFADRSDLVTAVTLLAHAGLGMDACVASPLYIIQGHGGTQASGAGKSYLGQFAALLACHGQVTGAGWASHDPYAIFSVFSKEESVILVDNVPSNAVIPEDNDVLTIITARRATMRAVGTASATVDCRRKIIIMAGNGLSCGPEMRRRIAVIRLQPRPRAAITARDADGLPSWSQPVERLTEDTSGRSTAVLLRALVSVLTVAGELPELTEPAARMSEWCRPWQGFARRVARWGGSLWGTWESLGHAATWQEEWERLRRASIGSTLTATQICTVIREEYPALSLHLGLTGSAATAATSRAGRWIREHVEDGGQFQCIIGSTSGRSTYSWRSAVVDLPNNIVQMPTPNTSTPPVPVVVTPPPPDNPVPAPTVVASAGMPDEEYPYEVTYDPYEVTYDDGEVLPENETCDEDAYGEVGS